MIFREGNRSWGMIPFPGNFTNKKTEGVKNYESSKI
jgi:hypothetical protein